MKPIADRFWAKVARRGPDECWLWTASCVAGGYGQIGRGGRRGANVMAHRLSYELSVGPIPPGRVVMHSCDTPPCVNPAHLVLGTQRDNLADMRAKDRQGPGSGPKLRGEDGPNAKLDWPRVREIRAAYANGVRQIDLAAQFGVGQSTISGIVRQQTWKTA